ncbi:Ulp1 protease family, carboxy-terminal domain protein [Sesbania bispinosa]|nr:Ulp1 protease family, carboxy-terminal domain protein [Sesbania bispinosa]
MAILFVRHIPMNVSPNDSHGDPYVIFNEISPKQSLMTNQHETELIMSNLLKPGDIPSNSEAERGAIIPKWMPVEFIPPKCMLLNELDVKIAAYIFSSDTVEYLTGDEVFIQAPWIVGKDQHLRHLCPISRCSNTCLFASLHSMKT